MLEYAGDQDGYSKPRQQIVMTSNQGNAELEEFCRKFALSIDLDDRQKTQLTEGAKRLFHAYETTGLWRNHGFEATPLEAVKSFIQELFDYVEDRKWCLNFLKEIEPVEVIKCLRVIDFVKDEFFPLYSRQELSSHLLQFHTLLKIHKDYLVKTGLMPGTFKQCMWLDLHVGHLYDTRTTSSTLSYHELGLDSFQVDSFLVPEQPYTWVTVPEGQTYSLTDVTPCKAGSGNSGLDVVGYDKASFQSRFKSVNAVKIEEMRLKNFNVRLQIFEELTKRLASKDGTGVLESCLEIFYSEFESEDLDYLLRIDEIYAGSLSEQNHLNSSSSTLMSGGILNLFEVIGHVEHELQAGMVHRLVEKIQSRGRQVILSSESELQAYIELRDCSNSKIIVHALAEFFDHQTDARKFWTDLSSCLANWRPAYTEVSTVLKVRRCYADQVLDLIPTLARKVTENLEAGQSIFPIKNEEKPWAYKCPEGVMIYGTNIKLDPREQDILLLLCEYSDKYLNYGDIAVHRDNWNTELTQGSEVSSGDCQQIRDCISKIKVAIRSRFPLKQQGNPILNRRKEGWRINVEFFRQQNF